MNKFMVADLVKAVKQDYPDQIQFTFEASSGSWKFTIYPGSEKSGGPASVIARHTGNGKYNTVINFPGYGDYEYPDLDYETLNSLKSEGASYYNKEIRITPQGSN